MKTGAITDPAHIFHLNTGAVGKPFPICGVRHQAAKELGARVPLLRRHKERIEGCYYDDAGDFVAGGFVTSTLRVNFRFSWGKGDVLGGLVGTVASAEDPMYPHFAFGEWVLPEFAKSVWGFVNGQYLSALIFHMNRPDGIDGDHAALMPDYPECAVIATLNPPSDKVKASEDALFQKVQHLPESLMTVAHNWRVCGQPTWPTDGNKNQQPKDDLKR